MPSWEAARPPLTCAERVEKYDQSMTRVTRSLQHHKSQRYADAPVTQKPRLVARGDGITTGRLGQTASFDGSASSSSACLFDTWMAGGRNSEVFEAIFQLADFGPDSCIGVVSSNWRETATPLEMSRHAVVMRLGDGYVWTKGKKTMLALRPLLHGGTGRLRLTVNMASLQVTFEVLGDDSECVLGALTVDDLPREVTMAVGFCGGGTNDEGDAPQRLRVVHCARREPDAWDRPRTKLTSDLWDEDNIVTPLHLTPHGERASNARVRESLTPASESVVYPWS